VSDRSGWVSRTIKFLSSVRLAIVLIILLILASVVGTLIPQGWTPPEYAARFGRMSGVLMRLQLTGVYHSLWFLALLLLLAANITVCTLSRLSAKWTKAVKPGLDIEPAALLAGKTSGSVKKPGPVADSLAAVRRELGRRRYRQRESVRPDRSFVLARKRTLGYFGSDLVHLGLLVILAGGILSARAGSREYLKLEEGRSAAVPAAGFDVRLERFQTELYPQGGIKAWTSRVTVVEEGRDAFIREIKVNHPLSHRGFRLYQSGYGWNWDQPVLELWVKKPSDPAFLEKRLVRPGEKAALPDGCELRVERFVPDFIIGRDRQVESRSDEPRNPAALVQVRKGADTLFSGWAFAQYPDFGGGHSGPEPVFSVELKDIQAPQYTILEASRDPGAQLIWLASLFICAGLFLAFYWPAREIRLVLEVRNGKTEITAGGTTAKSRESFDLEFQEILSSLRKGA